MMQKCLILAEYYRCSPFIESMVMSQAIGKPCNFFTFIKLKFVVDGPSKVYGYSKYEAGVEYVQSDDEEEKAESDSEESESEEEEENNKDFKKNEQKELEDLPKEEKQEEKDNDQNKVEEEEDNSENEEESEEKSETESNEYNDSEPEEIEDESKYENCNKLIFILFNLKSKTLLNN